MIESCFQKLVWGGDFQNFGGASLSGVGGGRETGGGRRERAQIYVIKLFDLPNFLSAFPLNSCLLLHAGWFDLIKKFYVPLLTIQWMPWRCRLHGHGWRGWGRPWQWRWMTMTAMATKLFFYQGEIYYLI